jgi:hypothetical protein
MRVLIRPFPCRVCLSNISRAFHRFRCDPLERLPAAAGDTNCRADLQPLVSDFADVRCYASSGEIEPLARETLPSHPTSSDFILAFATAAPTSRLSCRDLFHHQHQLAGTQRKIRRIRGKASDWTHCPTRRNAMAAQARTTTDAPEALRDLAEESAAHDRGTPGGLVLTRRCRPTSTPPARTAPSPIGIKKQCGQNQD